MGGKVCAIIGFGPGLGTAYAETFSQAGYDLGLLSRSGARLDVAEAPERSVQTYQSDAGNPDSLKEALASVQSDLGPIDVVIYNADLAQFGALDDVSEHNFEQSWRVGALGLFATAKLLGPQMSERGSGAIIVSGATAALRGNVWTTAFADRDAGGGGPDQAGGFVFGHGIVTCRDSGSRVTRAGQAAWGAAGDY